MKPIEERAKSFIASRWGVIAEPKEQPADELTTISAEIAEHLGNYVLAQMAVEFAQSERTALLDEILREAEAGASEAYNGFDCIVGIKTLVISVDDLKAIINKMRGSNG